ncbi:hypothetical protein Q4E93_02445 [Flavitalea sp. BT771]|uniref:hypothetical protein n=1 Tax=Flavitalea sp. BT771 TaxID=3063329 RepID=UPI0026E2A4DA|nr:hypothetical protein [Flavitalea sp. BT771]MDO6429431.1 hypothetical protein [Flavitalea sp. BT771]MDV6218441.1 hypothetical protein [Flavitalea sp. BT771]
MMDTLLQKTLSWLEQLAEEVQQDKAKTLHLKCKVTSSIMSHYPNILGPDMIEAAAAFEAIGETATCRRYFDAILADFQPMMQLLQEHPDEQVNEEDILSMSALLAAYEGLNRLSNAENYGAERAWLGAFIVKGVTRDQEREMK